MRYLKIKMTRLNQIKKSLEGSKYMIVEHLSNDDNSIFFIFFIKTLLNIPEVPTLIRNPMIL